MLFLFKDCTIETRFRGELLKLFPIRFPILFRSIVTSTYSQIRISTLTTKSPSKFHLKIKTGQNKQTFVQVLDFRLGISGRRWRRQIARIKNSKRTIQKAGEQLTNLVKREFYHRDSWPHKSPKFQNRLQFFGKLVQISFVR